MTEQNKTIEKQTLCMQLHFNMPGTKVKVDKSKLDFGNADESMLHVSKDIIDSAEYRAIGTQRRLMKAYVRAKALPSPIIKYGTYLIPLDLVENVQGRLDEMRVEFLGRVETFLSAYENGLVTDAMDRLGELFDPNDYPTAEELRKGFGVETVYVSMDVPGKLRSVSQHFFEREKKKAEQRWESLHDEVVVLMRTEFKHLIDKMVNSLTDTKDGKKKGLRKATVENLSDFLKTAPFRNVTDDKELSQLLNTTTAMLDGFDVEILKSDDNYRSSVRESFSVLKDRLDSLVEDKPSRLISFDEEDV